MVRELRESKSRLCSFVSSLVAWQFTVWSFTIITVGSFLRWYFYYLRITPTFFAISSVPKLFNRWRFQHLLDRPTSPYAIFKKSTLKSFFSCPLSKWFSFAFVSKQMIIRTIKVLIPKSSKSAVFFGIISIGVYAVNGGVVLAMLLPVFYIASIHIFIEVLKIKPFLADSNSSPAIILKPIMLRIKTALLHRTPYLIKSCARVSVFHSLSLAKVASIVKQLYTPIQTI